MTRRNKAYRPSVQTWKRTACRFQLPVSECLALNPVGRITYCIRLPGGPATCGVPRRELRFAPFRKTILFVFPSGLPILTGGDLRATLTPLRSGLRLERLFQPALASSQKNSSAHQLHSGPLMPVQLSYARRRKKLAGHGIGPQPRTKGHR